MARFDGNGESFGHARDGASRSTRHAHRTSHNSHNHIHVQPGASSSHSSMSSARSRVRVMREHVQASSSNTELSMAALEQTRQSQQGEPQATRQPDGRQQLLQERDDAFLRARQQAHNDIETYLELSSRQRDRRMAYSAPQSSVPSTSTSPPSSQHRVYLINCRSCGSFLTDRGMKAVLLLRPHITLYSTDAMPNCGPLHAPSRLAEPTAPHEPLVERTCDCLTQTLGCYGCGNAVGYHIVSPCERCTNSVAKHQRSSNGHRTVLHCAEISVRERRHVPGEAGVLSAPSYIAWSAQMSSTSYGGRRHRTPRVAHFDDTQRHLTPATHFYTHSSAESEEDDELDGDDDDEDEEEDAYVEATDKINREELAGAHTGMFALTAHRPLKRGDVLYWSDLAPGGERTTPIDPDDFLSMPVAGR